MHVETQTVEIRKTLRPTSRGKIIGRSLVLRSLVDHLDRAARASCTVLVTGESGTGKEMIVTALHEASPRSHAPLVTLNCGAIPEALLESELFGHAKGAFTGAHTTRAGRVAAAEGGTLFLDEVGELPLALQVKLLRLLQQREYSPVGDSRTLTCNIRVVAATNRDLAEEVRAGRFREDLFYRLNVVQLQLPSLRERRDDIPALAKHFLDRCREDLGREDITGFTPEALDLLKSYAWPGNIRELENAIERALVLTVGTEVDVHDLPASLRGPASTPRPTNLGSLALELPQDGLDLRAAMDSMESSLIRQALARTNGNKNRAAQLLGLNRTTLVEIVKRRRLAS